VFYDRPRVSCINFIGSARTPGCSPSRRRDAEAVGDGAGRLQPDDRARRRGPGLRFAVATSARFFHAVPVCFLCARKSLVERRSTTSSLARLWTGECLWARSRPADPTTVIGPLINDQSVPPSGPGSPTTVGNCARRGHGLRLRRAVDSPTILVDVPARCRGQPRGARSGRLLVSNRSDDAYQAVDWPTCTANWLTSSSSRLTPSRASSVRPDHRRLGDVNIPTIDDDTQAPIGGVRESGGGAASEVAGSYFTDLVGCTHRAASGTAALTASDPRPRPCVVS